MPESRKAAGDQFDTTIMAVEPHFPQKHAGPVGEVCAAVGFFQRGRGLVRCSHVGILCPVFRQAEPLGHGRRRRLLFPRVVDLIGP